jgi:hypothetical protein
MQYISMRWPPNFDAAFDEIESYKKELSERIEQLRKPDVLQL